PGWVVRRWAVPPLAATTWMSPPCTKAMRLPCTSGRRSSLLGLCASARAALAASASTSAVRIEAMQVSPLAKDDGGGAPPGMQQRTPQTAEYAGSLSGGHGPKVGPCRAGGGRGGRGGLASDRRMAGGFATLRRLFRP